MTVASQERGLITSDCRTVVGPRPPWFRILGVGLFFPKKANISTEVQRKIADVVKKKREGCFRVVVLDRRSRSCELTCCDEGMVAVDVYYPTEGEFSRSQYVANPSFVCARCFNHMGPCDYDPPMF